MTKVNIDCNEWYPVYTVDEELDDYSSQYEIPVEKLEWIKNALEEFEKTQKYLSELGPALEETEG